MSKKKTTPKAPVISEGGQRLRELTDQSLQLLDQLAEARFELESSQDETRSLAAELEVLRDHIHLLQSNQEGLEAALGDSHRRVRASRSLRSVGKVRSEPAAVDVVFWVPGPPRGTAEAGPPTVDVAGLTAAVESVTAVDGASCTLVCPPGLETGPLESVAGLTIVVADHAAPGQVFNLALASTDAPLVLVLAVGVEIGESVFAELGGLDDESIGLGVPRIEHEGAEASLGLVETELLELARAPSAQDGESLDNCEFAAPEAFFVRRAAFEQVGMFDEDLLGPAVLTDYSLRLQAESYRLCALPGCVVHLPSDLDLLSEMCRRRDRLLVIAKHRHHDLSAALVQDEEIWGQAPEEYEPLLQSLFARLPGASPEGTALYLHQFRSLLRGAIPDHEDRERYQSIIDALENLHRISCAHVSPRLAEIFQQLAKSVEADEDSRDRAALIQSMLGRVQLEVEVKGALAEAWGSLAKHVEELSGQARQRDAQITELAARLQRRDAAIAERDARLSDVDALLADRETQLQGLYRGIAERDTQIEALEAADSDQQNRIEELSSEIETCRDRLYEFDAARMELVKVLEVGVQPVSPGISIDAGASLEQLSDHIHAIATTLNERNQWIVALLVELCSKRIRLRRRKLAPHEQKFVDGHLKSNGQPDS